MKHIHEVHRIGKRDAGYFEEICSCGAMRNRVDGVYSDWHTPSDTDKMESWEKRFDKLWEEMTLELGFVVLDSTVWKEFINSEFQKAADSARVKVLEEIREKVKFFFFNAGAGDIGDDDVVDYLEQKIMKTLSSLTDTNTKEK